jgi:hypothetical protein
MITALKSRRPRQTHFNPQVFFFQLCSEMGMCVRLAVWRGQIFLFVFWVAFLIWGLDWLQVAS